MSGPKVINIEAYRARLRREAIRNLDQMRRAIEAIEKCELSGEQVTALREEAKKRLAKMSEFQRNEDWEAIVRHSASYAKFFEGELQREIIKSNEKAQRDRAQRRTILMTLDMLIAEANKLEIPLSPVLSRARSKLDLSGPDLQLEISSLASLISSTRSKEEEGRATKQLEGFLRHYQDPAEKTSTPREWARFSEDEIPDEMREVNKALLALSETCSREELLSMQSKADEIALETNDNQRRLLADSFILTLHDNRRSSQIRAKAVKDLESGLTLLAPFDSSKATEFRERITRKMESPRSEEAASILEAVKVWVAEEERSHDAAAKRAAVLDALGQLGYEARQGIALGSPQDGRIVVQNINDPNYGIELGIPANSSRMQVRVVAFREPDEASGAHSRVRDKEVETKWCSEFQKLRALLEAKGLNSKLEHAATAGELPVKAVGSMKSETGVTEKKKILRAS
jgi:hypothetical protein